MLKYIAQNDDMQFVDYLDSIIGLLEQRSVVRDQGNAGVSKKSYLVDSCIGKKLKVYSRLFKALQPFSTFFWVSSLVPPKAISELFPTTICQHRHG